MGLLAWLVTIPLGLEEDASLDGIGIIGPLYILSFAISGALVGSLWRRRAGFLGAFCLGTCAAGVVVGGCIRGVYFASVANMDFSAASLCVVVLFVVALGAGVGHAARRA